MQTIGTWSLSPRLLQFLERIEPADLTLLLALAMAYALVKAIPPVLDCISKHWLAHRALRHAKTLQLDGQTLRFSAHPPRSPSAAKTSKRKSPTQQHAAK